jgi:outer membrane lipoprotein carrier protein
MGVGALVFALATGVHAESTGLDTLIRGVEHRYNQARTLTVDFAETYTIAGHARRPESGTLALRKPGRMRWTYTQPAGKLFVSDGQNVFVYTAADNRVERSTLKNTDDLRAPMAFLLGKLDLKKEFRSFQTAAAGPDTSLVAEAKSDRLPYENVQMLIAPDFAIRALTVHGRDGSTLGFEFANEVINPPLPDQAFRFTPPPGAEIVDAVAAASGGN